MKAIRLKTKKLLSLMLGTFMLLSLNAQLAGEIPVKNIILMIGDGMGLAQLYASYTANKGNLNIFSADATGFSITYSADAYVTDSGAGGTAISTGKKTNNYSIGVDVNGNPLKSILETANEKGLSTGIVVTSSITHATPASFIAHQQSRDESVNIARDFINSDIDIFIGGGRGYFEDPDKGINISDSMRKNGYEIVYKLEDISVSSSKKTGCLLAKDNMPSMANGRGDYLLKAVEISLAKLAQNESGFFIMIEGSQIDWGGHLKNINYVIRETIDFDKTVGAAMKFADSHPGTLVIITADHETGGLSIKNGDLQTGELNADFSTRGHTGVMVPVFAYGTGAEIFTGVYQNTEIHAKMMKLLGLK